MRLLRVPIFVAALVLFVVLLEAALRLLPSHTLTAFEPHDQIQLPDDVIFFRPNPQYMEHDARGWRNESALAQADIVVLGDSQTYGSNARRNEAWPQVLSRICGIPTYQMAFHGFGPATYLNIWDEAMALKPKIIFATYYLSNDLMDSYQFKLRHGKRELFADPQIAKAEEIDPGFLRRVYLDCQAPRLIGDEKIQSPEHVLELPPIEPLASSTPFLTVFKDPKNIWHFINLALYHNSLIYSTLQKHMQWQMPYALAFRKPHCVEFKNKDLSTLLTPSFRLMGMTPTDPRIHAGEKISLAAFEELAERAKLKGVDFHVILIPSKELAYRSAIKNSAEPHSIDYAVVHQLWTDEVAARNRALSFFNRHRISALDLLEPMERFVDSGVNPYNSLTGDPMFDGEGHPNAKGYALFAKNIHRFLQQKGVVLKESAE